MSNEWGRLGGRLLVTNQRLIYVPAAGWWITYARRAFNPVAYVVLENIAGVELKGRPARWWCWMTPGLKWFEVPRVAGPASTFGSREACYFCEGITKLLEDRRLGGSQGD